MLKGELIGQGRTADVYAWGEDRILKLYQEHMPGQIAEREYHVTRAAQAAEIPVPAADQLIEVDGRYGIVFERLQGPTMLKVLGLQPWKIFSLARRLAELHAQVHHCTNPPDLPAQRQQIERGIQASQDLPAEIKQASMAYLAQMPEGQALCHGDFHPDNIIMTSRGPVIIDWLTGTRGNPQADVCRTLLLLQTGGLPPGTPLQMRLLLNVMRILLETVYLNRYLQLHPSSRRQIDAWRLPLLTARLCEVEGYPLEKQLILKRIRTILAVPGSSV